MINKRIQLIFHLFCKFALERIFLLIENTQRLVISVFINITLNLSSHCNQAMGYFLKKRIDYWLNTLFSQLLACKQQGVRIYLEWRGGRCAFGWLAGRLKGLAWAVIFCKIMQEMQYIQVGFDKSDARTGSICTDHPPLKQ